MKTEREREELIKDINELLNQAYDSVLVSPVGCVMALA
jgi:hypothetical protein